MADPATEKEIYIDMEPVGRRVRIEAGSTLLAGAQKAGVELIAICGGSGTCNSCLVRLVSGELSPPTLVETEALDREEIEAGYRLACQAVPLSNTKIYIPPDSLTTPQRLQIEGQETDIALEPVINTVDLEIDPPNLSDLRADTTRVNDALVEQGLEPAEIPLPVLNRLSENLRARDWSVRLVLRRGEIITCLEGKNSPLGLALDIGTTSLAAYLVDLAGGRTLAKTGAMNPQIAYGEDVISRILFAGSREGREKLQTTLIDAVNGLGQGLCEEANVSRERIVEVVAVGNTAMHHLFAGLPVQQLGMAPYVPAVSDPLDLRACEIGVDLAPGAHIYLPSNIAGFVGADHVAVLLANNIGKSSGRVVALDVGTNTEITLVSDGRLLSCSCASGPAFEGAHIHDGMRAAPGAIERVRIEGEKIHLQTIENQPPVGICGSGILDAVSEMLGAGILNNSGSLEKDSPLVRRNHDSHNQAEFVLAPSSISAHGRDIIITRKDINEIQLAKAAIRAGIEILLKEAGIGFSELDEFIVAGAFGTYLDIKSTVRTGMFPSLPVSRFRQVGNAAGMGAKQMLVSAGKRREAVEIAGKVDYIELTIHPDYMDTFLKAMYF
jgi:uncharacterized 2Fe-2S/4Fe-4S cluster protein (DUF4445 family)